MSPGSQSQIWCLGAAETRLEEVDMEILRGLENLGAPWDCMGRFPVTKRQAGIIKTIGANMILDMFLEIYHGSIRYRPDTGMGALVYSSLPC
jgi:hypothetical protein